jgi:uncharacterized protein (DUF779 family)
MNEGLNSILQSFNPSILRSFDPSVILSIFTAPALCRPNYSIMPRVAISPEATKVIDQLREIHGDLIFHQSGGCCDGSSPMCFPKDEFFIDDNDVLLGTVHDCPFYMSRFQFDYWKHTHLTLHVVPGRGASFSAEIPLGLRFIIESRLLTEEEVAQLAEADRE